MFPLFSEKRPRQKGVTYEQEAGLLHAVRRVGGLCVVCSVWWLAFRAYWLGQPCGISGRLIIPGGNSNHWGTRFTWRLSWRWCCFSVGTDSTRSLAGLFFFAARKKFYGFSSSRGYSMPAANRSWNLYSSRYSQLPVVVWRWLSRRLSRRIHELYLSCLWLGQRHILLYWIWFLKPYGSAPG